MKIGMALGLYFADHVGGAEVQTSYLVRHFLDRGHEVALVHFGKENIKGPMEEKDGFSRYQVKLPRKNIKSTSYLNKKAIFGTLDEMGPEILYQRGDFHFTDLISSYGHSRGVPVVSAVSMERHCYPEPLSYNHMFPVSVADRMLKKRYYRWSTLILTQTEHQRRTLKKNLGFDSTIVQNGHPLAEGPFPKDEPPLISWVANIKPVKRPFEFLKVCQGLPDARFIMAGKPDSSPYQKDLERTIGEMGNVEYVGGVTLEKANEIIGRSLLFINTSESEGFSNTYIQAWMRKTPVITMSADPDGVLQRERIGARTDTVENTISVIKKMLEDRKGTLEMGERARTYAGSEHDIIKIGDRLLELFEGLVEGKGE